MKINFEFNPGDKICVILGNGNGDGNVEIVEGKIQCARFQKWRGTEEIEYDIGSIGRQLGNLIENVEEWRIGKDEKDLSNKIFEHFKTKYKWQ